MLNMIRIERGRVIVPFNEIKNCRLGMPFKKLMPNAQWMGKEKNSYWIPASRKNIDKINKIFGLKLAPEIDLNPMNPIPALYKTQPRPYQMAALTKCNRATYFGYFMEPGLGKTKVAIDDVEILHHEKKLETVVVICPKSAIPVWLNELKEHGYWNCYNVIYWDTKPKIARTDNSAGVQWLIMNPEALTVGLLTERIKGKLKIIGNREDAPGFKYAVDTLIMGGISMLILDESTYYAKSSSLRTKQIMALRKYAEYRRILTGTPFADNLLDVYPQMRFLDDETIGYRSFKTFKSDHAIMGGYKGKQIQGYRNREQITEMINTFGFRCLTRDVEDLKEPIYQKRWITLSNKAISVYNDLVEETILRIDDIDYGEMQNIFLKLQQVTGGFAYDNDGNPQHISSEKLNEIKHLLNEIGSNQVLIWCHFSNEVDMLIEELSTTHRVGSYRGGMNLNQRQFEIDSFNEGKTDILVIQDDAGHMALTINAATYAIFYSHHPRAIVREQAERRNWRIGQKETVVYIDLLCENMRDHQVYEMVKNKIDVNSATANANKEKLIEMLKGGLN